MYYSTLHWKGIFWLLRFRKLWISDKVIICQCIQEGYQICLVLCAHAAFYFMDEIAVEIACVMEAGIIMINALAQVFKPAIVHIG